MDSEVRTSERHQHVLFTFLKNVNTKNHLNGDPQKLETFCRFSVDSFIEGTSWCSKEKRLNTQHKTDVFL